MPSTIQHMQSTTPPPEPIPGTFAAITAGADNLKAALE